MKMIHLFIVTVLVSICMIPSAHAGGSFYLTDIQPLLKDSKEWQEIQQKYAVDPTGDAVRFGRQWTNLGAGRCGPYQLTAKLKGTEGPATQEITIETHITFLKNGKPITKHLETEADDYKETPVKITVRESDKEAVVPNSPEGVVRKYFEQVNERKEKEAFDCFSPAFQERRPFKNFSSTFADTKEVQLFTAKTSDETQDTATVTIRLVVWDAKEVSSAWSGLLKLTKSENSWKIDDMSGLIEK